jgi:hypothetical protein
MVESKIVVDLARIGPFVREMRHELAQALRGVADDEASDYVRERLCAVAAKFENDDEWTDETEDA